MRFKKFLTVVFLILFSTMSFAMSYVQTYSCTEEMEEKLFGIIDEAFTVPGVTYSVWAPCRESKTPSPSVATSLNVQMVSARGSVISSLWTIRTDPLISKVEVPSPLFAKKLIDYIESEPAYDNFFQAFQKGNYEINNLNSVAYFYIWQKTNPRDYPLLIVENRPREEVNAETTYSVVGDYDILYLDEIDLSQSNAPDGSPVQLEATTAIVNEDPLAEAAPLEGRALPPPAPIFLSNFPEEWVLVGLVIVIGGIIFWVKRKKPK